MPDGDVDRRQLGFIIAFDVLNLFSVITLSAVFLTAYFSPRIRRVPTWYLYIFSWDVYSLSYVLIVGKQTGAEPIWGWCLCQAVAVYASPVLAAASIVIFVTQIYLDIRYALGFTMPKPNLGKKLMIAPGLLFISICCEVLILGLWLPDIVGRSPSGMFCHINMSFPSQVTAIMILLCTVVVVGLGVSVAYTVHRNQERWQCLIGSREFKSYDLVFRIAVFILAPVIAIGLLVMKLVPSASGNNHYASEINIMYGIPPTLVGIVSGSQKDLWHVWIFWRSPPCSSVLVEGESQGGCILSEKIAKINQS